MHAIARPLAFLLAVLGVLLVGPGIAPAGAQVVSVEGTTVGLQPRNEVGFGEPESDPANFANPAGGPVLPSSRVYAIYWDPTDHYHGDWQNAIDTFLQDMGTASSSLGAVFAVDSQYADKANQHASYDTTFMGAVTDTEPYPTTENCKDPDPLEVADRIGPPNAKGEHTDVCLTDKQIRAQLEDFIARHAMPTGMSTIFYLLTPPGVTVCLDGGGSTGHCSDYSGATLLTAESYAHSFCSYHSDISPTNPTEGAANTILYGVIPWTAGGLGDPDLLEEDQTPAYDCQDGGFNPASEPPEEKEKAKEKTTKEKEELEKKTLKEKKEAEELEKLEGPHQEEPNQLPGLGPDGGYDHGLADLIVNQVAIEQQNIVTDPLLNGWQDREKEPFSDALSADEVGYQEVGYEVTDECRNVFFGTLTGSATANKKTKAGTLANQSLGGNPYYLNDAFNLAALRLPYPAVGCISGVNFFPHFTAPNPVNAGEIVGFDGMESDIELDVGTAYNAEGKPEPTYATYTWNFGDGSSTVTGYAPGQAPGDPPSPLCEAPWLAPCAGSTFHSYKYGGTYEVTLTVTDVGDNTRSVTEPITVVGPPPPGSGSGSGGSGSASSSTTSSGSTGSGVTSAGIAPLPAPVATAAATSNSLEQVAKSGLVVHYTVNEQVAGRFEVLLDAATARRLGISGPAAINLPAGSPKSLVIGHALLVTTKGGRSSVKIKFSKSVAKHLSHAHKVKLTLRLTAHNADAQNPLFTTVMSTVELHR